MSEINHQINDCNMMLQHVWFYLGLSFLFIHELDAIRCKEWRIFPLVSWLNDKAGERVFVFAHIPLFCWIFIALNNPTNRFIQLFDAFMVVHGVLHLLFLLHPKNEFKDFISWMIIICAAVCGIIDLAFT